MSQNNNTNKSILSWSGGKDAALTLYLLQQNNIAITSLFTTINKVRKRITMHGVHVDLLEQQVKSLGCSLDLISLPENISMAKYNDLMGAFLNTKKKSGINEVVFGDIYLENLRKFRDEELKKYQLKTNYPLWKRDTLEIAKQFISLGFKAIVVAVSSNKLDEKFAGKEFDIDFLNSLPENVDPCGENGEFHTFVYDGPNFKFPIPVQKGKVTYQTYETKDEDDCFCEDDNKTDWDKGFWFCDLILDKTN